eukprot:1527575-Amphidinium_carterae.2
MTNPRMLLGRAKIAPGRTRTRKTRSVTPDGKHERDSFKLFCSAARVQSCSRLLQSLYNVWDLGHCLLHAGMTRKGYFRLGDLCFTPKLAASWEATRQLRTMTSTKVTSNAAKTGKP